LNSLRASPLPTTVCVPSIAVTPERGARQHRGLTAPSPCLRVASAFRQVLRTDDGADIWMSGTTRMEINGSRAVAASAGVLECSDGRYAWLAGTLFAGVGGVDLASGSGQWDVYRVTHGG